METELVVESQTLKLPITAEIQKAAQVYLEAANAVTITSNDDLLNAAAIRDAGSDRYKVLWALLNPPCQEADAFHSKLTKNRDLACKPYDQGSKAVKQKMIAFTQEQERKRQLEQARLDAIAKKKAEDEALELAETLQAAGATDAAAEVLDAPIQPAATVLPKATPKIVGFSSRRIYDAEVVDRKAFFAGIVAGTIPDAAWEPCRDFLRDQVKAYKEELAKIWPGVKVSWKDV